MRIRGNEALIRLLDLPDAKSILDVGSGTGAHADVMRSAGRDVTTISMIPPADHVGDFITWPSDRADFDAVWACHVLEHQVDPGAFLRECRRRLRPGGWLAVTVPPLKNAIVGGHVSLWNAGLLLYHLVLAGFDCRQARVGTYGYNISVIVQNVQAVLPPLISDNGDIKRLAHLFPALVGEGFDGVMPNVNWELGADAVPFELPPVKGPDHVAILGLGPSLERYVDTVKRLGGRHAFADEIWGINAVGGVIQCDRVIHMDDVRIQEIRAAANPDGNIGTMLKWMRAHPGPIVTSRAYPDYPGLVEFPLEAVINDLGYSYFNSTAAYAVALAIHVGAKKISLFGCDYSYANSHHAEKGRACVEFWLGIAAARGIALAVAENTTLMDACEPDRSRLYGYGLFGTRDVTIRQGDDGSAAVEFTERAALPSAAEIEAAYDHGKPTVPAALLEINAPA